MSWTQVQVQVAEGERLLVAEGVFWWPVLVGDVGSDFGYGRCR